MARGTGTSGTLGGAGRASMVGAKGDRRRGASPLSVSNAVSIAGTIAVTIAGARLMRLSISIASASALGPAEVVPQCSEPAAAAPRFPVRRRNARQESAGP